MSISFEFGIIYGIVYTFRELAIKLGRNVLTGNQNYNSPGYILPEQLETRLLQVLTDILVPHYIDGDVTLDGVREEDGDSQKNLYRDTQLLIG